MDGCDQILSANGTVDITARFDLGELKVKHHCGKVFSLLSLLRGHRTADVSHTHTGPPLKMHQRLKSGCECWRNKILSLPGKKKKALCVALNSKRSLYCSALGFTVTQKSSLYPNLQCK